MADVVVKVLHCLSNSGGCQRWLLLEMQQKRSNSQLQPQYLIPSSHLHGFVFSDVLQVAVYKRTSSRLQCINVSDERGIHCSSARKENTPSRKTESHPAQHWYENNTAASCNHETRTQFPGFSPACCTQWEGGYRYQY